MTERVTTDIAPNATFGYVIVGCGILGLVVANHLTESADVSVLCIEAGSLYAFRIFLYNTSLTPPSDSDEPDVTYHFNIGTEIGGPYDWNIGNVPQTQLNGNSRSLPAGHFVGGGSIINGMVWNRGQKDDFDAWASFGNSGWTWNDLLPYFIRVGLLITRQFKKYSDERLAYSWSNYPDSS